MDVDELVVGIEGEEIVKVISVEPLDDYKSRVKIFFEHPPQDWHEEIKKIYASLNLETAFNKMKLWLLSNPNNRKKNFRRFCVNWLNREVANGRLAEGYNDQGAGEDQERRRAALSKLGSKII